MTPLSRYKGYYQIIPTLILLLKYDLSYAQDTDNIATTFTDEQVTDAEIVFYSAPAGICFS